MTSISAKPHLLQKIRQQHRKASFKGTFFLSWLALIPLFTAQAALPSAPLPQAPYSLVQRQPGSQPLALDPDPTVQEMIDQVQSSALYYYVAGLSGEQSVSIGGAPFTLDTRSTTAAIYSEKATQYAFEHFQSLGLAVSYHTWLYYGSQRRNVVAEQAGADPDCLYLLTAHLDNTSPTPSSRAPGADDNASGVAGVFVAADILSHYQFTCTLRYVLFTGEEQGLYGSDAYAKAAAGRGDPILGVLNLDMIAYNTPGSPADIEMDIRSGANGDQDQVLSTMVSDVIQAYELDLTALLYASDDSGSDHYSFWMAGFPAILAIEDTEDLTPNYHTLSDTVDTLNLPYFTDYVKAIVGAMAHLGKVTSSPPPSFHMYLPLTKR
jgi:Zn-dependent M28 family amino/carboxypeptidase